MAPYDGVVTVRNANTGDYVESVAGDKTNPGHPPLFVVARTDLVRVFIDVPEEFDAMSTWARRGPFVPSPWTAWRSAVVARTSWSLNEMTRSLRTEFDLPVRGHGIRPGMYAYAYVVIEHPHVLVVPEDARLCWATRLSPFSSRTARP